MKGFSLVLWALVVALGGFFVTPEAQGKVDGVALLKKVDELYRSQTSYAQITMRVETPHWKRTLKLEAWSQGMKKTFIRILSPQKDKGVSTLRIDKEMWNFFPKINKVIKVPPSMMMGSWMGSDFTNDDLVRESSLVEDYSVDTKEIGKEYHMTLTPKKETATVWGEIFIRINKKSLIPIEQSYFDEKGEKIRVMEFSQLKKYGSKTLPSTLKMVPLNKKGHQTVIVYDQLKLDVSLPSGVFSLRNLKKR